MRVNISLKNTSKLSFENTKNVNNEYFIKPKALNTVSALKIYIRIKFYRKWIWWFILKAHKQV